MSKICKQNIMLQIPSTLKYKKHVFRASLNSSSLDFINYHTIRINIITLFKIV